MNVRTNAEWLAALRDDGARQTDALVELRAYLLRASRYALSRYGTSADLDQLAEDAAQDALTALLRNLDRFRGESRFTTWAYTFAVNAALVTARRERWGRVAFDAVVDARDVIARLQAGRQAPDPQRRVLQAEMLDALCDAIEAELTPRQRDVLTAVVVDGMPLDEFARRWDSNRNALYKLLHDARRKVKAALRARGVDPREMLDVFGDDT